MGIEPTSEAWEASILPLYDARSRSNAWQNITASAPRATSPRFLVAFYSEPRPLRSLFAPSYVAQVARPEAFLLHPLICICLQDLYLPS